jgi:uncharacterized protein (DUF2267 family)
VSGQGLETIESSTHKAYEWIARLAERAHLEKSNAYRALRAALQTVCIACRWTTPCILAHSFRSSFKVFIVRGWEPSKGPIKNVASEFLATVKDKIVTDKGIDPIRITGCLFEVIGSHVAPGDKLKHCKNYLGTLAVPATIVSVESPVGPLKRMHNSSGLAGRAQSCRFR